MVFLDTLDIRSLHLGFWFSGSIFFVWVVISVFAFVWGWFFLA